MKSMTKIQQSYEAGALMDQDLGGVPAHVYLECEGKQIDMDRLRRAWKKTLSHHGISSTLNDYVPLFDCSQMTEEQANRERMQYRDAFQQRMMRRDLDHFCGLTVFRLPNDRDCLHFDMSLMAGDPAGFQILLGHLGDLYQGRSLPEKQQRTKGSDPSGPTEEDIQYWDSLLPQMKPGPILPMIGSPEKMHHCSYRPLWSDLTRKEQQKLEQCSQKNGATVSLWAMAVFARLIQEESGTSFLLNVPVFGTRENEVEDPQCVMDRTRLLLLPIFSGDREQDIIQRFHEAFSHIRYDGMAVQDLLRRNHPNQHLIAPTVFSATPGIPLISKTFRDSFGDLTYLVSQTPQVCLDAQIYEREDSMSIAWIVPEGLYDAGYLDELFARYRQDLMGRSKERLS